MFKKPSDQRGFGVIIAIVVVIVAVIAIIVFVINDKDDTTPVVETPTSQTTTNPESTTNPEQPTTDPTPTPGPEQPQPPETTPTPEDGQLPSDWGELTTEEKIARNPLGCDLATQTIWASDGSCHDKDDLPEFPFQYVDGSTELICEHNYYQNHQGPSYCSLRLRVVLLNEIDVEKIYSDAAKRAADRDYQPSSPWPSFVSSVSDFTEERCLKLRQSFARSPNHDLNQIWLSCRDNNGQPPVMQPGEETSITVGIRNPGDNISVHFRTNPEATVNGLQLQTIQNPPISVSLGYVVLSDSLANPCSNYQQGSGVCGIVATVAIKGEPVESEIKKIARKFIEKYGPEEGNIRLTVLRHNGSDKIEDYQVYGIGYGPVFNSNHKCGRYYITSGTGNATWSPEPALTLTPRCQQAVQPLPEGFFATPQPDLRQQTQAPLRYVENSIKVACSANEASFCQIELEVVLLEDIDIQRGLENRWTMPDFILPPDWLNNNHANCLGLSSDFFTLSGGNVGLASKYLSFACHDQLPDQLQKGGKYRVSGPAVIPDNATIDLKSTPKVQLINVEVDRSNVI